MTDPPAERSISGRALAMGGYALVAASLFTVWITGLAAFVVAFLHRKHPDPVARSHFRFSSWSPTWPDWRWGSARRWR